MVQSVKVDRAASQLASPSGSDCPSSPTCSTVTVPARMRGSDRRRAVSDGSTA